MTVAESTPVEYGLTSTGWARSSRGGSLSDVTDADRWAARPDRWLRSVAGRLEDLLLLECGWDGGVAPAVDPSALEGVWSLATQLAAYLPDLTEPRIIPTVNGGVAMEWVRDDAEFSIECGDDDVLVSYYLPTAGEEWEGDLDEVAGEVVSLLYATFG